MVILAVYYTVADIVLLIQCLVYNNRNSNKEVGYAHLNPANPLLDEEYHHHHHHHHEDYGTNNAAQEEEEEEEEVPIPPWKDALYNLLIVTCVILSGIIGWWFSASSGSSPDDEGQKMDFWGKCLVGCVPFSTSDQGCLSCY